MAQRDGALQDACAVPFDASKDTTTTALAASEERFRLLVEQVTDYAIFLLDTSGNVTSWNAGAERLVGYSVPEILGRHFSTFYRAEDTWKCAVELETATREGRVEDEGWRIRKDGTLFWANVVITALHDDRGALLGFAKVTRDLTDRRLAEEALRASEERMRLLVEGVKDYAIFMLDPTGVITTWNVGAERIKGYRADEIIGSHFSRFYPEDDVRAGKCERALETAARDGRFEDEMWRVRKDGTWFWANVIITAVRDAHGELIGFAKVTRDLTERRRAEQERLRLAEQDAARRSAERVNALLLRVQALTASLAAARTPQELAEVLVRDGCTALGATSGVVLRPAGDAELELVAARNPTQPLSERRRVPLAARVPSTCAFREHAPEWVETREEFARRYRDIPASFDARGAAAALPLLLDGRAIGVMAFRFDASRRFPPDERALMQTFAVQAAQAFDRAEVYAREVDARRRIEALELLAEVLSSALTTEEIARVVVEHGMRAVGADTCTLHTLDPRTGDLELVAERGCRPQVVDRIRRVRADPEDPVYKSFLDGRLLAAEDDEGYAARYPELAALAGEGRAVRAFWSAALVVEGRSVGLLGMGYYAPRAFPPDEIDFVRTFARQCAEATRRAQRVEEERAARDLAERLRASLSTTLRSIADAVVATDARGAVTVLNPVAEALTGWREAEALGRPLGDVFRTTEARPGETALVARSGRAIPIEHSAAPIRGDGAAGAGEIVVFRDATAAKLAESRRALLADAMTALAESLDYEATLAKVARLVVPALADWCSVDLVRDGAPALARVAVAHVDPRKAKLAQELRARYPARPDASVGAPSVVRSGRSELHAAIPDELLASWCVDDEHLRVMRELGARAAMVVPLAARGRALGTMTFVRAEPGRAYGEDDLRFAEDLARRCGVAIDNARLYASEQRARQSADVANRAKDEFLAMVSHELRTPLNAIMGWAKMMTSPGFDELRRARAVDTIERNAVAMAQLIEDLLDMSRIISGKMRLEVHDVDLAQIVEAAIESAKPAADAKGIRIAPVLDARLGAFSGDPTRLQQVVWNLLSNAVKFTSRGGRVDVSLRLVDSAVEIAVADTGKGIAPQFLPCVFDAFRQEDASASRARGGLGLGLAITRQLVELHGGRIEAQSEGEGKGATFTVRLPVSAVTRLASPRDSARPPSDAPFERPSAVRGLRVLVVDDEDDARQLVRAVLEDCGCRVTIASGVDDAMQALAREVPDVLVSDIGMPERDGYELIRRVRALAPDHGGDVPAAALTAYARAEDRRRMLNAGYSMHIPKPVEPAELVAVVASLTRFARGRGERVAT